MIKFLFGCRHRNIGTPVTWRDSLGLKRMTVFCRDCAGRVEYDWANMRVRRSYPLSKQILFQFRWWLWFFRTPNRIYYGFGPNASENWNIAMDRWDLKEPKLG